MSRLTLLATLVATPALAQQAPVPDAAGAPDAPQIVVTAVRAPTVMDRLPSAVTVLDRAAIDAAQPLVVSDLLARTPGVNVARNGGLGGTTSVFIRGADSAQTVLVIDGVKLNDPSAPAGGYDFSDLMPGDAARIEVLRGIQSTLWGSQAIGGVVNVVTALPTRALEGNAQVEGGSRGTASGQAAVGGKTGGITWQVAGNGLRTDGISAIAPAYGGQERDGYDHVGGSARLLGELTPTLSLDLRGYVSHGRAGIDSSFGPPDTPEYIKTTNWIGYAGANLALFDGRLRNRVAVTRAQSDRDSFDPRLDGPDDRTFLSRGRTTRVEYQGSLAVAAGWTAIFGAEHEQSRFRSISPQYQDVPDRGTATSNAGYAEVTGTPLPALTLTGGLRYERRDGYAGRALPSFGGVWAIAAHTRLRARYAEGFKAPSLYELYSQYGAQDLRPERAHEWEASVEQTLLDDHVSLSAGYFARRTRDLIDFAYAPFRADRPYGYYQNVARAAAQGVETAARVRFGPLAFDGNYSWIDSENRSPGGLYGNDLARRPRQLGNATLGYTWNGGLVTAVALRTASHSYDDAANTIRLGGYALVDLRAELPLGKALTLYGRIENVTDKRYQTAYRYGTLGRSVYGGIRARF